LNKSVKYFLSNPSVWALCWFAEVKIRWKGDKIYKKY